MRRLVTSLLALLSALGARPSSLIIALGAPVLSLRAQDAGPAQGRRLFESLCSRCHGIDGVGGQGPSLRQPVLRQAPDDEVLRGIILNGLPTAGMPSIVGSATPAELTQMIAYVRSLGTLPVERVSGDVERGRAIYSGRAGCSRCHMVSGNGGILGPELTSIGATRGSAYLRAALLDPARELPTGPGMPYPGSGHARFLLVRVIHKDGRRIAGIRLNEDGFTIQVRDTQGRLFSFEKSELASLEKLLHGSLMPPSGGALSPSEVEDVIAYLLTLRGTP